MKVTRIAGRPYDAKHATEMQRLIKVHEYVSHIRSLAHEAARETTPVHTKHARTAPWSPELSLRLNT